MNGEGSAALRPIVDKDIGASLLLHRLADERERICAHVLKDLDDVVIGVRPRDRINRCTRSSNPTICIERSMLWVRQWRPAVGIIE